MNMTAIEAALVSWWQDSYFNVQIGEIDRPRDYTRPDVPTAEVDPTVITGARVFFEVAPLEPVGVDETRWTVDPMDATRAVPEVTGNRIMSVNVQVESYNNTATTNAAWLCERGRTRARMPHVMEAFRVAGMGLIDTSPITKLPFDADGRVYSKATFDIRFNVNMSESVADSYASGYTIAIVLVTSDYQDQNGDSLPSNLQLADEPIDSTS